MPRKTVMLVEPDYQLRAATSLALRSEGWFVLDAGSGEAAIGLIRAFLQPIDVVVASIKLTGSITGIGVVQEVRRTSPNACAIYLSDAEVDTDVALITKPYAPSAVVAVVSGVCPTEIAS